MNINEVLQGCVFRNKANVPFDHYFQFLLILFQHIDVRERIHGS
jgi:hypothetical protein